MRFSKLLAYIVLQGTFILPGFAAAATDNSDIVNKLGDVTSGIEGLKSPLEDVKESMDSAKDSMDSVKSSVDSLSGKFSADMDIQGDGEFVAYTMMEILGVIATNGVTLYNFLTNKDNADYSRITLFQPFIDLIWNENIDTNILIYDMLVQDTRNLGLVSKGMERNLFASAFPPPTTGFDPGQADAFNSGFMQNNVGSTEAIQQFSGLISGFSYSQILKMAQDSAEANREDPETAATEKTLYDALMATSYVHNSYVSKILSDYEAVPLEDSGVPGHNWFSSDGDAAVKQIIASQISNIFPMLTSTEKDVLQKQMEDQLPSIKKYVLTYDGAYNAAPPAPVPGEEVLPGQQPPRRVSKTMLENKLMDIVTSSAVDDDAGLSALLRRQILLQSLQLRQDFQQSMRDREYSMYIVSTLAFMQSFMVATLKQLGKSAEAAKQVQGMAE